MYVCVLLSWAVVYVCMHICLSMPSHLFVYRCTLSRICVYAIEYMYVCCRVALSCMCVCMYVALSCMPVCVYAYAVGHVCKYVYMYACMHVALSLNARSNRWSGKQGYLVRHCVKVVFGMFYWVCSVCFIGHVHFVCYVSLKCKRREQDATSFCSVVCERSCVICDNLPGREQKL
jgi:hypothetical protein